MDGSGGILISAGEASGDLHGAGLVAALRSMEYDRPVFGLGGSALATQGVELLARNEQTAVTGILEVLSHVRLIYRAFRRLVAEAKDRRPDLAVLIDYPDFNLRLARKLNGMNIPVMYYISPQVWAWRKGRIRQIKRLVKLMLVILPFEEEFYREAGVPVSFVGHPLVDVVRPAMSRDEFFRTLSLDPAVPLITLLPGSRRKEIGHHLPVLTSALGLLKAPHQALVVKAPTADRKQIESLARNSHIRVIEAGIYDAMSHADLVLTSCGTATVETALCGTPMIAYYRLSPLTYVIGKPLVRVHTYAMCNILAGRRVVPELIQREFTPERVASEADRMLADRQYAQEIRVALQRIRERLGPPGASTRAAQAALHLIGHGG
ncbi:MAG: lipid-A-disaccharide synthase [Acidobacteriota bacterium]